jgi:hypothetical protein
MSGRYFCSSCLPPTSNQHQTNIKPTTTTTTTTTHNNMYNSNSEIDTLSWMTTILMYHWWTEQTNATFNKTLKIPSPCKSWLCSANNIQTKNKECGVFR